MTRDGAEPGALEVDVPFDPSRNVMALVDAESRRQDDLRNAESARIREVAGIREEHAARLRQAESARIDAIRAVDVGAVNRAAEVAATQANTLAAQVATSAETLRTQVGAAATAWEARLLAALDPIQKDIQDLRKAQYEAQGQKTQVVETQAVTAGDATAHMGTRQWWGIAIAAAIGVGSLFIGLAGVIIAVILKG